MNYYLESAKETVQDQVKPKFENTWSLVTGTEIPDYDALIWGSTVDSNRQPNDLDVILAYEGEEITDDEQSSIESILIAKVMLEDFDSLDPLVTKKENVSEIIANSRTSTPFCVNTNEWLEF